MAKLGLEYQELVALVARALDPKAEIKTGQWLEGPDGNREVDVEVRGSIESEPQFILIECKDWKRPVDIQEIDKLDSKRQDLFAQAALIYSNSGFTKKALRKAERVGIGAVSAIAMGNQRVRVVIEREVVVKALSVDNFQMTLYPNAESESFFFDGWDYKTLRYDGVPVANWLRSRSNELIQQYEGAQKIVEIAAFKAETLFSLERTPVVLRGFRLDMQCRRKWLSQTVREDVSLGTYDHIKRRLIVPSQQYWSLGVIDREAWRELDIEDEPEHWSAPLDPGGFRLNLTLLHPISGSEEEGVPPLDELIGERVINLD